MTRPWQLIWLGVAALGLAAGAVRSEGQAQEMPCTDEIRTLCADVQPGGGRIMQCLKNNEAKLSMTCAGRLHDLQETMAGPLGACRDDWVTYCYHPWASTSRQGMIQCLQANQPMVSASCQKALQSVSGKRQQHREMMP